MIRSGIHTDWHAVATTRPQWTGRYEVTWGGHVELLYWARRDAVWYRLTTLTQRPTGEPISHVALGSLGASWRGLVSDLSVPQIAQAFNRVHT